MFKKTKKQPCGTRNDTKLDTSSLEYKVDELSNRLDKLSNRLDELSTIKNGTWCTVWGWKPERLGYNNYSPSWYTYREYHVDFKAAEKAFLSRENCFIMNPEGIPVKHRTKGGDIIEHEDFTSNHLLCWANFVNSCDEKC